ncbi:MAG: patatin-like phospholipase family protein [Pseudomonadota bacterium]
MQQKTPKTKKVNVALQGGGAHGAFTWGVLDRLLEHDGLEVGAVTGASAGAINAVALADGLADGCPHEARKRLRSFWEKIIEIARTSPFKRTPFDAATGTWNLDQSPMYLWFDMLSRVISPYDLNPMNFNPLLETICELIDFERVQKSPTQAFIAATSVETGRSKVFKGPELTAKHIMASACLPFLYQAVEIDGTPYWDGGYMGNPPLWPLFDDAESDDVIIVQINPFKREGSPKSARDIANRLNEITFNASLMRELRAVDFVSRLISDHRLDGTGYRNVHVHIVEDEPFMETLGASSKLNTERAFITLLFDKGREAADRWLAENWDDVGVRSTMNLRDLFDSHDDALDGNRLSRLANFQQDDIAEVGHAPGLRNGRDPNDCS